MWEFNTIAVDDGIAMGHAGMLYSAEPRPIADAVEYMVNAHCADALVCISNCDKITPGMLWRHCGSTSTVCPGGPMEAGRRPPSRASHSKIDRRRHDPVEQRERHRRPAQRDRALGLTCGSCSGMFTANSMNCLAEAIGLALPGNG